jgi:hypothetical protein
MNQVDSKPMKEPQTTVMKILDLLIGVFGSLIMGNLGLLLFAQFDPQRIWISSFKWVWLFVLAVLAVILYTRNRIWISIGIVAAMVLMAF